MRRTALIAPLLVAAAVLAGCSSAAPSRPAAVSVSGRFGAAPSVRIPAAKAASALTVRTLVRGAGPVLASSDVFISNYAVYVWSGTAHHLAASTFSTHSPQPLLAAQLLPGLRKALVGQKMGSRVLAVIPPAEGYGKAGNPQAGIKGTDTLVFVVDMLTKVPHSASGKQVSTGGGSLPTVTPQGSSAPRIAIPAGSPPSSLVTKTLIKGSGPAIVKGDTVIAQYVGEIWRTRKVFDSSWSRAPFTFRIGSSPSQVITGWDRGLLGDPVGSRVLLVIPPKDGYGKSGQPQAGIKGNDTLVFVVDLVGAVGPGQPVR
jgi:FKBP-type peptidyl-prolyl cis-trans isomerase